METFMRRLRRRKVKKDKKERPPNQHNWRSWFKSPLSKDSARDFLPCFGRVDSIRNSSPPPPLPVVNPSDVVVLSDITISENSMTPNLADPVPLIDPVRLDSISVTDIVAPDIVVFSDLNESSSVTDTPNRPKELFLKGGEPLRRTCSHGGQLTPIDSDTSPALSKSSLNQLFPFCRDYTSIFVRRMSSSSAGRKKGLEGSLRAKYHWTLIRQFISFSFAIRGDHRKPWVQLAGHEGSFQTGECGTVLKKLTPEEHHCLEAMMDDVVKPFVPLYMGTRDIDGQDYIEMRDLLTGFDSAVSVMDCKLGLRTYLEDELTKAKEKPTLRPDMYLKMIEVDENEPTPEEHQQRAVTKPRYMQWRETISSTATLGFRVEGVKKPNGFSSKDFKFTKERDEVVDVLKQFITDCSTDVIQIYIHRLKDLRKAIKTSTFFATHEVIGSSLLLIHDTKGLAGVWMIDFAKTVPLPFGMKINHAKPWKEGNHEDGYLIGLNNLISCFDEILHQKVEGCI